MEAVMLRSIRTFALPAALALAFAGSGCIDVVGSDFARHVERDVKTFTTVGTPTVSLSTFDGSIEVRQWDKPQVEVVIERRAPSKEMADSIQVDAKQSGDTISIDVKVPPASGFGLHFGSRSAKLIVSTPAKVNLAAKSGDGSIDVGRLTGTIELRSGDGSIKGSELHGDVRAHTGDGSIHLDGVDGALDADTGDGSIVVSGAFTTVHARSGDGSVKIRCDRVLADGGDWNIVTGDGSVALEVPDGFNAELDAHTGSGRVNLQDVTVSNVSGELDRHTMRGRIGSGGRSVKLRSGDGSIRISTTSRAAHE
jgi:DUF4097 and DUF4098 domain-containing protein YvlB